MSIECQGKKEKVCPGNDDCQEIGLRHKIVKMILSDDEGEKKSVEKEKKNIMDIKSSGVQCIK